MPAWAASLRPEIPGRRLRVFIWMDCTYVTE
jgi:hypothetical protein